MGLIIDPSLLIADERGQFDMPGFLRYAQAGQPARAAITASELLHGVERAADPANCGIVSGPQSPPVQLAYTSASPFSG